MNNDAVCPQMAIDDLSTDWLNGWLNGLLSRTSLACHYAILLISASRLGSRDGVSFVVGCIDINFRIEVFCQQQQYAIYVLAPDV